MYVYVFTRARAHTHTHVYVYICMHDLYNVAEADDLVSARYVEGFSKFADRVSRQACAAMPSHAQTRLHARAPTVAHPRTQMCHDYMTSGIADGMSIARVRTRRYSK